MAPIVNHVTGRSRQPHVTWCRAQPHGWFVKDLAGRTPMVLNQRRDLQVITLAAPVCGKGSACDSAVEGRV